LLDFHLARPPFRPNDPAPVWMGGTPGFMSPEQEAAFAAVSAGRPIEAGGDGRSDIYSPGVLVYEALAGEMPPAEAGRRRLRSRNPGVSVGLADIIGRCLARNPADRYPDADSLADDLRRHLGDRPLQGVPNRSPVERWRKWRRRRPYDLIV